MKTYTETEVQAIRAAALREAVDVLDNHDGAPCRPGPLWQDIERDAYISGQLDASTSWRKAILAMIDQPADTALNALIGAIGDTVGFWLSAALEDPQVCDEMKADIGKFFMLVNGDALAALEQVKRDERERCAKKADAEAKRRVERQMKVGATSGTGLMHGQVSEAMLRLAADIRGEQR